MLNQNIEAALAHPDIPSGPASSRFHSTSELVGLVAQYLNPDDLLSAALMSRTWRHEASRQLCAMDGRTLRDVGSFDSEAANRNSSDSERRLSKTQLMSQIRGLSRP